MKFILQALQNHSPKMTLTKLTLAVATITISQMAAAETLQKISVTQPTSATTELNLDFVGQPVKPVAYQLDNPARLVLDFANADSKLARVTTLNQGNIKNVTALSNDTTTRLIVELNTPAQYTIRTQDNRLIIAMQNSTNVNTLGASVPVVAATVPKPIIKAPVIVVPPATQTAIIQPAIQPTVIQPAPVVVPVVTPVPTAQVEVQPPVAPMVVKVNPLLNPAATTSQQYNYDGLTAISQHASGAGGSEVVIGLVNENVPLDVQRSGDELVIRMSGATVPNNLLRQMNVNNGLVRSIVTNNQGRNGVIRITMNGDYEYKAYQSGGQLNITINPPKRIRQPTLVERTYTGAPISMDFENMDVRQVLKVLAMTANTNIVASDSVTGNITLSLIDIPWDQALDIILKAKNLDKRVNGKVIWVAPADELQKQETSELEAQQKIQDLAPIRTEYIRLNYAKAISVRTLIESQNSNRGENNGSGSLLSPRGTVTIDERTNTLIIKDTSDSIVNIRELIAKIDIPVRQVMIEARIVSATDSFSKEIGVKWGILSNGISNNRNLLVGGSDQTIWDLKKYDIKTATVNGQSVSYPSYTITRPDNLNVDLGVTNPAGSIAFGLLTMSDLLIDLELSAMQADGKGEVISSPKVLTADKQKAKILSGTQIPYEISTSSGATAVSWIDAALSLEVTPNITPEGRIAMELMVENGAPATAPNGALAVNKDAINTNVIVDDGQTVVLGGVFKNTLNNGVDKVPFLGDLPYVGNLFKRTTKRNDKQELLIFVTPKLVTENVNRIN